MAKILLPKPNIIADFFGVLYMLACGLVILDVVVMTFGGTSFLFS